jgi:hypothetical protein
VSKLIVIGDDTPFDVLTPPGRECGLIPFATYRGDEPQIFSADKIPLIPWEEMPDRIADQERQKSSLWHVWKESKIGANDQNGLPYCHAASAVNGIALVRELAGLPYVELSIGSVGGPVTGYPASFKRKRATELSTPPEIPTNTFAPSFMHLTLQIFQKDTRKPVPCGTGFQNVLHNYTTLRHGWPALVLSPVK